MRNNYLRYFDTVYGSSLIAYAINLLVGKGKRYLFENFFYRSFYFLSINSRENPYLMFFENIEIIRLTLDVNFKTKIRKRKKKIIVVPKFLTYKKQYKKGIKLIRLLYFLRLNREYSSFKLFNECINLSIQRDSFLITKKHEIYEYAVNNKLNKHYR